MSDLYPFRMERIYDPSKGTFHYIRKVTDYQVDGSAVVLNCRTDKDEKITVRIDLCTAEIFRLRMEASGKDLLGKRTHTVVKEDWEKVSFRLMEKDGVISIKTKVLTLEVQKDPYHLSVYDSSGSLICRDSDPNPNFLESALSGVGIHGLSPIGFSVDAKGSISVFKSMSLAPDEHFYGFGEKFSPLDKRGRRIISWITDAWGVTTDTAYKSVPFFMSTKGYGIFINSSYRMIFEMGSEDFISYAFEVKDSLMDYYFIYGPSFKEIIGRYIEITGRPSVPPKWAFGLWMARFGYRNREELEGICEGLRSRDVPCDVVHLDPFWLRDGHWCDLEWNEKSFPNPREMIRGLREKGFKLCLWVSPWVPADTDMFKEGKEKGFLAKNEDGSIYETGAFGGKSGILDFSNPATVKWVQGKLKRLLEMGASVFKTDFGEGAPEEAVYQNGMTGKEMHNLFPLLYNKTFFDAVKEHSGKGLVWGRSAYAGNQRYPANWSGDPSTRFSNLTCVMRGGLSNSLSVIPFWSHDIGGFLGLPSERDAEHGLMPAGIVLPGSASKPSPVLYVRWAQFGFFSPLSRCHGTMPREPWEYGEEALKIFRKYAKMRYRLIPYIYSYAQVASQTGISIVRPMILEYQDDLNCYDKDLQYVFGEALLVAPILDETGKRKIYLPKGRWIDYWNGEEYDGPINIDYEASLDILPLFVKGDSIIPMGPEISYIGEKPSNPLTLDLYVYKRAEFTLRDDEETIIFKCSRRGRRIKLDIGKSAKRYILKFNKTDQPRRVMLDSRRLKHLKTEKELKRNDEGWWYNSSLMTALVKISVKGKKATVILE